MTDVDRPEPLALPGASGLWVPSWMCAALASVLATVLGDDRPVPLSVVTPRPGGALERLRDKAREAAIEHHRARHRAASAAPDHMQRPDQGVSASAFPRVADFAEITPPSPEVTTAEAVALAGLTERRWRQLAAEGLIDARPDGTRWLLSRASVIDYRARQGR